MNLITSARALGLVLLLALALGGRAWAQDRDADGRLLPGLRVSAGDAGETSVRVPVDPDRALQRRLSPYLSIDSHATAPEAPGSALRPDTDLAREVRVGAGVSLPVSERLELFGEYHFLRLRPAAAGARGLLEQQSDGSGPRAGFTIKFD